MASIRIVRRQCRGNKKDTGLYLMFHDEVLAGPFKTTKEAVLGKFEWFNPRPNT